jgi:hypothetical protein
MMISRKAVWGMFIAAMCVSAPVGAQTQDPAPQPAASGQPTAQTPTPQPQAPVTADPDTRLDPLQPDFALVALPTTLRMPEGKFSFRVTHRFLRSLGSGWSDVFNNFFEFDSGAQIGLEVRYGLFKGTDIGVHRTSDRTIEIFGQQSIWQQKDAHPISLDAIATFEGQNNLRAQKSPALGVLASRKVARIAAVYAEPIFVFNTNPLTDVTGMDQHTFMVGLGGRVRVSRSAYVVGEITPRVAGYMPGVNQISFGLEGRVGGHLFQVNFSNGYGTTLGQLARGGVDNHSWFIGFNISRKFF